MNDFTHKNSFSFDDLIHCAQGNLFGEGNARLPMPNMLMISRITKIHNSGGSHSLGYIKAELDINPDLWFFKCHFENDPVMPGCLGLDAMWQLLGFYLAWAGLKGRGRALGCGEVKFIGEILPSHKLITYEMNIKKLIKRSLSMVIGNGFLYVDSKLIYTASDLRVGLFTKSNNKS